MLEFKIMGSEFLSFRTYRPFFDRSDYPFWKHKMELYFDNDLIRLWDVILDGLNPLMEIVEGIRVLKERSEWSQEGKEENHKNKMAMSVLISSMSKEEGGKVKDYILAKKI